MTYFMYTISGSAVHDIIIYPNAVTPKSHREMNIYQTTFSPFIKELDGPLWLFVIRRIYLNIYDRASNIITNISNLYHYLLMRCITYNILLYYHSLYQILVWGSQILLQPNNNHIGNPKVWGSHLHKNIASHWWSNIIHSKNSVSEHREINSIIS